MKAVYIAHVYQGNPANRAAAAKFAALAAEFGYCPMCSWIVLTAEFEETPENKAMGLALDCEQVERSDELWLCGPELSEGMRVELNHASSATTGKIRVRDFVGVSLEDLRGILEWHRHLEQS